MITFGKYEISPNEDSDSLMVAAHSKEDEISDEKIMITHQMDSLASKIASPVSGLQNAQCINLADVDKSTNLTVRTPPG